MVQLERVKELQEFEIKITLGGVGAKILINDETDEAFVFETEATKFNGNTLQSQDLSGKTIELNGESFTYIECDRKETTLTIRPGQHATRLNVIEIDNGNITSFAIYFGVGSRPNDRKK